MAQPCDHVTCNGLFASRFLLSNHTECRFFGGARHCGPMRVANRVGITRASALRRPVSRGSSGGGWCRLGWSRRRRSPRCRSHAGPGTGGPGRSASSCVGRRVMPLPRLPGPPGVASQEPGDRADFRGCVMRVVQDDRCRCSHGAAPSSRWSRTSLGGSPSSLGCAAPISARTTPTRQRHAGPNRQRYLEPLIASPLGRAVPASCTCRRRRTGAVGRQRWELTCIDRPVAWVRGSDR